MRTELARAGTLQYLRTFWFFLIGVPISGVLLLIFLHSPVGLFAGTLCLLWPISIPGRILSVSWKKSSKLNSPTIAELNENELLLRSVDGATGTRIPAHWVRNVWEFGDLYVVEGKRLNFVLVRKSAFKPAEQAQLLQILRSWTHASESATPGTPLESN